MPSFRIEGSSVSPSVFDVVGTDGDEPCFIAHAGLAESAFSCEVHAVPVFDMGPPLRGRGRAVAIRADAIGSAELDVDELHKIRVFIDLHAGEHASLMQLSPRDILHRAPEMYCIFPHAEECREDDGRYARTRFSCAGFALEAYKSAGIMLLYADALPAVSMDVLRSAYPEHIRRLESGRIAPDSLGLTGAGPWPVLLCGYLFHSLARSAGEIREQPYSPTIEDRFFTHEGVGQ